MMNRFSTLIYFWARRSSHRLRAMAWSLTLLLGMACALPGSSATETSVPVTATAPAGGTPTLAPTADSAATPVTDTAGESGDGASGVATPTLASGSASIDGNGGTNGGGDGTGEEGSGEGDGDGDGSGEEGNGTGDASSNGCGASANLLQNPGFEGAFVKFGGIDEINHGEGWFPWWDSVGDDNFPPEYKPADASLFANRVHSGQFAQQYFKSFGMFKAGLYQIVPGITPGCTVNFSIYAQAWSCEDPATGSCPGTTSVNPANPLMRIGIDPTGGADFSASTVVWSPYSSPLDAWQLLTISAVAQSDEITVFLWASPDGPRRNQDVYWDDASLTVAP